MIHSVSLSRTAMLKPVTRNILLRSQTYATATARRLLYTSTTLTSQIRLSATATKLDDPEIAKNLESFRSAEREVGNGGETAEGTPSSGYPEIGKINSSLMIPSEEGPSLFADPGSAFSFEYRLKNHLYHDVSDLLAAPHCPSHPVEFLSRVISAEAERMFSEVNGSVIVETSDTVGKPRITTQFVSRLLKDAVTRVANASEACDAVGDVQSGKDMATELAQLTSLQKLVDPLSGGAFSLALRGDSDSDKRFNEWSTPLRIKVLQAELAACSKVGWWQNAFIALNTLLEEERRQLSNSIGVAEAARASKPLPKIVSPQHFIATMTACGTRNSRAFDMAKLVYRMATERYGEGIALAAKERMGREGRSMANSEDSWVDLDGPPVKQSTSGELATQESNPSLVLGGQPSVLVVSDSFHSSLLQHLAKSISTGKEMNDFRELFRSPSVSATVPVSVPLYTAIMLGCEQAVGMEKRVEFAVALYRTLRDSQLVPTVDTYTTLMGVCASERETTTAFAYYREALAVIGNGDDGTGSFPPRFYTNLLRSYAAGKYASDTLATFQVLKEAGAPLERLALHVVLSVAQSPRVAAELIEEAAHTSGLLKQPTVIGDFRVSLDANGKVVKAPQQTAASVSSASPITNLPSEATAITPTTLSYLVLAHRKCPKGQDTLLSLCDIHHHAVALAAEQCRLGLELEPGRAEGESGVSILSAHKLLCNAHPTYVRAVEDALFSTVVDLSVQTSFSDATPTTSSNGMNVVEPSREIKHFSLRGLVVPSLISMVQHNMTHSFLLGKVSPQRPSSFPEGHRPLVAVLTAEVLAELDLYMEPFVKYFSSLVIPFSQLVRFKRDCGLDGDSGDELVHLASSAAIGNERRIDEGIYESSLAGMSAGETDSDKSSSSDSGLTKPLSTEQFAERGSDRRNRLIAFLVKYKAVTHIMSLEEELQMSPDIRCYGIPLSSMSGRAVAVAANLSRGISGVPPTDPTAVGVGTLYSSRRAKFIVVSTDYPGCGKYIKENKLVGGSSRHLPVSKSSIRGRRGAALKGLEKTIKGANVGWLNPEQRPNWSPPVGLSIPSHLEVNDRKEETRSHNDTHMREPVRPTRQVQPSPNMIQLKKGPSRSDQRKDGNVHNMSDEKAKSRSAMHPSAYPTNGNIYPTTGKSQTTASVIDTDTELSTDDLFDIMS